MKREDGPRTPQGPALNGFTLKDPTFVPGTTVGLSPVEGKNLAGDPASHTTTEKPVRTAGENAAGTSILDETHQFRFGDVAAGVYKLEVPSGWRAKMGGKGALADVGGVLSPLAGDVELDVTPATATLYGRVTGADGFPLDSVTVTANSVSAMTDAHGRYILEGLVGETRRISNVTHTNKIFLQASGAGFNNSELAIVDFAANAPMEQNIDLSGVGKRASISGTVRASGTNAPVAGALILVDGAAPLNAPTRGVNKGKLLTGADGTYTALIAAKDLGQTASVSASKDGMTFVPASLVAPAHAGAEITGIDFTGFVNATITGRVAGPNGRPLSDVKVTATPVAGDGDAVVDTTATTGTFSLSVPFGSYTIMASLADHIFEIPAQYRAAVNVAPGQVVNIGTIQAATAMARGVNAVRVRNEDDASTEGVDESQTYSGQIRVTWTGSAEDVPAGYENAVYSIETNTGTDGAWADASATVNQDSTFATFTSPSDATFMVRVVATAANDSDVDPQHATSLVLNSGGTSVDAIDPSASGVSGARSGDTINVSWKAVTDGESQFRVVAQVSPASLNGSPVSVVLSGATPIAGTARSWSLLVGDTYSEALPVVGQTTQTVTVTAADLNKAITVRVDARQDGVDEGENGSTDTWTEERRGTAVSVGAKPTS